MRGTVACLCWEFEIHWREIPRSSSLKPNHNTENIVSFLRAFAKPRNVTLSFAMSVCQFARMEQLCSHWTNFHKICYFSIFLKSVQNVQVLLECDKNNGHLHTKTYTVRSRSFRTDFVKNRRHMTFYSK
jgi:hypothetical protein